MTLASGLTADIPADVYPMDGTRRLTRPGRKPGARELVFSGLPFLAVYRVREDVIEIHGCAVCNRDLLVNQFCLRPHCVVSPHSSAIPRSGTRRAH